MPEKIATQLQYRRILLGRDLDQVENDAFRITRIGLIAEHTGWSYAEITKLDEVEQTKLATFYGVKEQFDRGESKIETHLNTIAGHLQDIYRKNEFQSELLSWTTQKRLKALMDVLIGPDPDLEQTEPFRIPLLALLEDVLRQTKAMK